MSNLPYKGIYPRIAEGAFVAPNAVIVGDVTIEEGASVWFGTAIRGDMAPVRIGARTNVQDNCTIHVDEGFPCIIGEDCSLGHNAVVHGATLGDRVLVGMHATVLNGAQIGDDCVIAAGAVVAEGKRFEPGTLIMGVPGRAVRAVTEEERRRVLVGSGHYQDAARVYAQAVREHMPDTGA